MTPYSYLQEAVVVRKSTPVLICLQVRNATEADNPRQTYSYEYVDW